MTQYTDGSLWLSFKLDSMDYCILSDYIESIAVPGKIEPVPNGPASMAGITNHGGNVIGVVELRTVFGLIKLKVYTEQFAIMRDMHVSWVQDLMRYVCEGGEFTKPVDPHKCKFGLWYDGFRTDNNRLNRLLKKIAGPHERIHQCGAEIIKLKANGEGNRAQIEEKLAEAQCICEEDIIPLLNRLIDIYCDANRGVILVVNDGVRRAGILVDEVKTLIPCQNTTQQEFTAGIPHSEFLREIVMDGKKIMLSIDVERVIGKGLLV